MGVDGRWSSGGDAHLDRGELHRDEALDALRRSDVLLAAVPGIGCGPVVRLLLGHLMRSVGDIRWLAGYLEGEGSFMLARNSHCGRGGQVVIAVTNTDEDVLRRALSILGGGTIRLRASNGRGNVLSKKPIFQLRVCGTLAAGWAMTLFGLMGSRRREQICRCLLARKETRVGTARGIAPGCHPERPWFARGLCKKCYRDWNYRSSHITTMGCLPVGALSGGRWRKPNANLLSRVGPA